MLRRRVDFAPLASHKRGPMLPSPATRRQDDSNLFRRPEPWKWGYRPGIADVYLRQSGEEFQRARLGVHQPHTPFDQVLIAPPVLLDLNGELKLDVSFVEKEPNHPETDRCLRIYASGVNSTTFPFLYGYSTEVPTLLRRFISKPEAPSSNERLHALVKYGSTVEESHMRWEAQRQHVE